MKKGFLILISLLAFNSCQFHVEKKDGKFSYSVNTHFEIRTTEKDSIKDLAYHNKDVEVRKLAVVKLTNKSSL